MQAVANCTCQQDYWNKMASSAHFTHPVDLARLGELVDKNSLIVDYGCGYGRLVHELAGSGRQVIGLDTSASLIERGRCEHPELDLRLMTPGCAPLPDESVDAVLLIAVLTCIADDVSQHAVISDVRRILRPGGILIISDYGLQTDARNLSRYKRWERKLNSYGCFEIEKGVIMRHHMPERFGTLLLGWQIWHQEEILTQTFRGNPVRVTQLWGKRPIV